MKTLREILAVLNATAGAILAIACAVAIYFVMGRS
jgi:hypothetical protein